MPVPNVQGVPPLPPGDVEDAPGELLSSDDDSGFGDTGPQWGIFKNGELVIESDAIASFDYRQDWTISDYPVERGGFQSYDKVQSPFDIKLRLAKGGSLDDRTEFLESIEEEIGTTDLYDAVTPEKTYENVNLTHRDFSRKADNGLGLIVVELWATEVRVTAQTAFSQGSSSSSSGSSGSSSGASSGGSAGSNVEDVRMTASPSGARQQSNGITQTENVSVTAKGYIENQMTGTTGGW